MATGHDVNSGGSRSGRAPGLRAHAHVAALLRLIAVPLSLVASLAADGNATERPVFLAIAAVCFAYSVALWVLVRRGTRLPAVVVATDVLLLLAFVVAADPREDGAGRLPVLLLIGGWALTAAPRTVLVRGIGLGLLIMLVQLAVRGGSPNPRIVAAAFVCAAAGAVIAVEVRRRDARTRELQTRADELLVEVADLERRERERIAQLVHDDALQRLLAARQDLDQGVEGDADSLVRAREGLAAATASLRHLTRVVHDEALEAAGLEAAVQRIVDDTTGRTGLRATVHVDGDVCGDANTMILAVVRELTANVERHAQASSLEVAVRRRGAGVSIVVQDDGRGLTAQQLVAAEAAGHLGHAALRRRVAQMHGTVTVDATPGAGTRVEVVLADADVRARRALEQALRHERGWNAALVAGFPDPFVVSTPELRLVEVSDRFVELTGFTRAELLSAPAGDLPYWPLEHRAAIRAFAAGLNDELEHEVRFEIVCKDGRRLDVLATATIVVDPRGGRRLQLITFKDLTGRRGPRGALAAVTQDVARRTRQRTAGLTVGAAELE